METGFNAVQREIRENPIASEIFGSDAKPSLGVRSLRTLVDLGLSDRQIAHYFGLSENRIVSLQRYYGLK